MTKRKRNDDHVRINSRTSTMNCEHCGASEPLRLPMNVHAVMKVTGKFLRKHRECPAPKLEGLTPHAAVVDEAAKPSSDPALEHWKVVEALNRKNNTRAGFAESAPENWERFKASVASARRVSAALEPAPPGQLEALAEGLKDPAHPINRTIARLESPALPRSKPCGSCPYRRDVPAGVWAAEEYSKLPRYDAETFAQPVAPFFCHSQDGTVCAGWLGCHEPSELLAVRLGTSTGRLDPSCLDYSTDVPLFESGAQAAAHGASGVKRPSKGAREVIRKLERARRVRQGKAPKPRAR